MNSTLMGRLIDSLEETLVSHGEELTRLDRALQGGRLGSGLARAAAEVRASRRAVATMPFDKALKVMGAACANNLDSNWSAVFGGMLDAMADAAPNDAPSLAQFSQMLDAAILSAKADLKAEPGDKTLLDVLCPITDSLRSRLASGNLADIDRYVTAAAAHGLHKTTQLKAVRGPASKLEGQGLGHMEPGACAVTLILASVVAVLTQEPA